MRYWNPILQVQRHEISQSNSIWHTPKTARNQRGFSIFKVDVHVGTIGVLLALHLPVCVETLQ